MLDNEELTLLRQVADHAVACEEATGVPAEVTTGQWALESGWGKHMPGNNCFGIKAYTGAPDRQLINTHEWFGIAQVKPWLQAVEGRTCTPVAGVPADSKGRTKYSCQDWFAAFPDLSACFIKHAEIFTRGFLGNVLGTYKSSGNLVAFIQNMAPTYATDPAYSTSLISVISMPEVQAAIKAART